MTRNLLLSALFAVFGGVGACAFFIGNGGHIERNGAPVPIAGFVSAGNGGVGGQAGASGGGPAAARDVVFDLDFGEQIRSIDQLAQFADTTQVWGVYNVGGGQYGADTCTFGEPVGTQCGDNDAMAPLREFTPTSLLVHVRPKDRSAPTVGPARLHDAKTGSFYINRPAKSYSKPELRHSDGRITFETRFRLRTVAAGYWFALWASSLDWQGDRGPEADFIEAFSAWPDCCVPNFWHSDMVGSSRQTVEYMPAWGNALAAMTAQGLDTRLTSWHVLRWVYETDDRFTITLDGVTIQSGTYPWHGDQPITFLFEYSVGHTVVWDYVDLTVPATAFPLTLELDYARAWTTKP